MAENEFERAGKTAVSQNIHGTVEFLQKFPPFNQMDLTHLVYLVEHCQLRFYSQGESILKPSDGPVDYFYIVKQGLIRGARPHAAKANGETTFEITTGECFPLSALIGERATRTEHIAAQDSFCLLLRKAIFIKLFELSAPLRDFALRGVSSLLDQVNQQVQLRATESLGSQYSLDSKLSERLMRKPVSCAPDTTVREAVKIMHEQHVGSIVIVSQRLQPLGIFTLRDLRRVIADGSSLELPIEQLMTAKPFRLPASASTFDAAIAMTERNIAHVCVVEHGQLSGVVSERDLFSLQRVDLVYLARSIRNASKLETLINLRSNIQQLVDRMLAHGASSTQITQLITQLNDHTVCRVIELTIEELGDPGFAFTWLCFGSEGRREQTLLTDQDNGIMFAAENTADAAAKRERLLPLAHAINLHLAQCGFTLCKGNIMAGNPELCLSQQEWSQRFDDFISNATPENLLGSCIYFDLRVVWGEPQGCAQLRTELLDKFAKNTLSQRMLAENALRQRPPVGRFRDFVVARKGVEKDTLDLKVQGLTPFVDGARLLALANGIESSNTLERLQGLIDKGVIDAQDGAAYEEAYHFIQQTRMQHHQQQAKQGLEYSNRIDPDRLNHLDRRILRESFRQAKRLQSSLALRYQL
ncbi:putative nucleotidyltransferase substrate binding domain-containing protein [Pseudomonas segetis]|uniref:CBS domain-containing protein n=1 Tax=Pseudomonas segetis TaxID=298908 RepID=A0A239I5Y3_9PSED|nr:putative nucleotidyltransferase substrate binding domain-containing protein [Pseudomonas segetis]SNS88929.1 CBS domain-containing protein [Pseudomonas segetis]